MKRKVEFSTPEAERDYKKFKKAMDKKYRGVGKYIEKKAKHQLKCPKCGHVWEEDALRLQLKAMVSRLNSEGLDLIIDYINKEYGDMDMGITLTKVKAIGLKDIGMETEG